MHGSIFTKMKKFRVWAYETQGHYIEIDGNNEKDANDNAKDVDRENWIIGNDNEPSSFTIDHTQTKEIK